MGGFLSGIKFRLAGIWAYIQGGLQPGVFNMGFYGTIK